MNPTSQEQIETWKDLFGIEERYIDKICSQEATWWLIEMADELNNHPKTKSLRFKEKLKLFEKGYVFGNNFLKIPYLQACYDRGLIK